VLYFINPMSMLTETKVQPAPSSQKFQLLLQKQSSNYTK